MPEDLPAKELEAVSAWWQGHPLYDPAHEFQLEATFEESHCILGGLQRLRVLGNSSTSGGPITLITDRPGNGPGKREDALIRQDLLSGSGRVSEQDRIAASLAAFCERVVSTQGIQGVPEALFMGYGLQRKAGCIRHSCVADQASVANAVLEVAAAFPEHAQRTRWLQAIQTWSDWVAQEFSGPGGGIGVGILSHEWNPMETYWCATSLYCASQFRMASIADAPAALERAMSSFDWLSRFDFSAAVIPDFSTSPGGVLLYFCEGLAEGLEFLADRQGPQSARSHPAADKAREALNWLASHQQPSGSLPAPATRGHRTYELGLPWLVLRLNGVLGPEPHWAAFAERFLDNLCHQDGKDYYGLYIRPWAMGLAQLSLATWTLINHQLKNEYD